ncbi:MAG: Ig-like domain-containing protein [Candidatus Pacebacteria bacterium]|nr:Ig-like domain-containing protein [Candidatus Paceibacterota bacterium]
MKNNQSIIYFLFFILVFGGIFFISHKFSFAAGDATIDATVKIAVCGNNIREDYEECDGSNLNNQSCVTKGFSGGTLSCKADCVFNTSACTSASPPSSGGSGGYRERVSQTAVNFSGRAYPKSTVTILKDAQIAAMTIADANANFSVTISELSVGNYIFSVYSEDDKGNRSPLLTFPVSVTSRVTTNISSIFIAPSIAVDKSEVKRGENVAIFGQTVPQADITITINSDEEYYGKTLADASGAYLYNFDTSQLDMGQHYAKSKAALSGTFSPFSKVLGFTVGTKTVLVKPTKALKGDMSGDGRVNLVDFSIAAYWHKRANPPASVDLNGDGKVDLIDFSIMAFYWTG